MSSIEETTGLTIDEALAFADEWSRGATLYRGLRGWRIVTSRLAEEVRRLQDENANLSRNASLDELSAISQELGGY